MDKLFFPMALTELGETMRAFNTFLVISLAVCQFAFADEKKDDKKSDEQGFHAPGAIRSKRNEGGRPIQPEILKWISEQFLMSEEFVKSQWADDKELGPENLPEAIAKMRTGDDSRIAPILAQLMGTLNPTLAKKVFENTRDELLKFNDSALDGKGDDSYRAFLERLLFSIYSWPNKKEKAQAFCMKPVLDVNAKLETEKKEGPKNWAAFQEKSGEKELFGLKEKPKEEDVQTAVEKECYGRKEGKDNEYANETYDKFLKAFTPAAKEVWAGNVEYHKAAKDFEAAVKDKKIDEAKAALAAATKGRDPAAIAAFSEQQRLSKDADNKPDEVARKIADTTYKVLAWTQKGNNPSKELKFTAKVGSQTAAIEANWNDDKVTPSEAVEAKMAEVVKADKLPPGKVPTIIPGAAEKVDPPAAEKPKPEADPNAIITAAPEFKPAADGMVAACTGCHAPKTNPTESQKSANESFPVADFSKMTKAQIIEAAGSVDRMVTKKGAKITPDQVTALKAWAAKLQAK